MRFEITLPRWLRSTLKAIIWLVWNIAFGLAPFLLVAFIASFKIDPNSNKLSHEEYHHLLNDCVILFFCTAIMAEITIEAFLCKVRFSKYYYLGFCSVLFISLIIVLLIYYSLIAGDRKLLIFSDLSTIMKFQTFTMWFSGLFCIFIKATLFWEEDKMNAICQSVLQP